MTVNFNVPRVHYNYNIYNVYNSWTVLKFTHILAGKCHILQNTADHLSINKTSSIIIIKFVCESHSALHTKHSVMTALRTASLPATCRFRNTAAIKQKAISRMFKCFFLL